MNRHEHGHRHHDEAMLSVEDALERILDHFHVLDTEEVPLLDALGQVLAQDAVSLHDIPAVGQLGDGRIRGTGIEYWRRLGRLACHAQSSRLGGGGRTAGHSG